MEALAPFGRSRDDVITDVADAIHDEAIGLMLFDLVEYGPTLHALASAVVDYLAFCESLRHKEVAP